MTIAHHLIEQHLNRCYYTNHDYDILALLSVGADQVRFYITYLQSQVAMSGARNIAAACAFGLP